jgi:hypothetical protein
VSFPGSRAGAADRRGRGFSSPTPTSPPVAIVNHALPLSARLALRCRIIMEWASSPTPRQSLMDDVRYHRLYSAQPGPVTTASPVPVVTLVLRQRVTRESARRTAVAGSTVGSSPDVAPRTHITGLAAAAGAARRLRARLARRVGRLFSVLSYSIA